jgi:cell division protease FtsH
MSQRNVYSEKVLDMIDSEVRRIVMAGYERAVNILKEYRSVLDRMAEALLIRETLDAQEILRIMNGETLITEKEKQEYAESKKLKAKELEETNAAQERERAEGPLGTPLPQGT